MQQVEWFSDAVRYDAELGYAMLQLPRIDLPSTLSLENTKYEAKEELHCSLLCIKVLAEAFDDKIAANTTLTRFVKEYIKQNTIEFEGFTQKCMLVSRVRQSRL